MVSAARALLDCLVSLSVQVREIRGLLLVDHQGLPMVSTLGSASLEDTLSVFGGSIVSQLERAQADFQMGPIYMAHFVGRDRQVFVAPVTTEVAMVAIVEAQATPGTITMHLLALSRELVPLLSAAPPDGASIPNQEER